ncbi:hypothetical protein ACTHPH_21595 [Paenibacillus pasadenensis]|uniref:hypothetical protein n=1 Tax=Paenibacillus pasadenensis TaxID=217090 RepID=UPI00040B83ED|nr:hypothetical protein [Paenibacillus pasadenensis]
MRLVALAAVAAAAGAWLYGYGIMPIWQGGMAAIASDKERYSLDISTLPGEYSMELDLTDLSANVGRDLYRHGDQRIWLSHLELNSGLLMACFRSDGTISWSGATLASGLRHARSDSGFGYTLEARMDVQAAGSVYEASGTGMSGINYRKGDMFCYFLFPDKAAEEAAKKEGKALLVVEGLQLHRWSAGRRRCGGESLNGRGRPDGSERIRWRAVRRMRLGLGPGASFLRIPYCACRGSKPQSSPGRAGA